MAKGPTIPMSKRIVIMMVRNRPLFCSAHGETVPHTDCKGRGVPGESDFAADAGHYNFSQARHDLRPQLQGARHQRDGVQNCACALDY